MTKHTKYPITTRIYIPHLCKYVFVIFIQVAKSKTQIFGFINKSQWFRTDIYRRIKIICNISVYKQYRLLSILILDLGVNNVSFKYKMNLYNKIISQEITLLVD